MIGTNRERQLTSQESHMSRTRGHQIMNGKRSTQPTTMQGTDLMVKIKFQTRVRI